MSLKTAGVILGALALLIGGAWLYEKSGLSQTPLIFSPTQVLGATWARYKVNYLEEGTFRTLDKQRENITTSEGQSYTLLRAVWMGDKQTFDSAWQWTKDNLQHQDDSLFAWLFGEVSPGEWGILTAQGGDTTASDADEDIALALIFAYVRWQDEGYLEEARAIITDIWEQEVMEVRGTPYLLANNREKDLPFPTALINPSYLSPATYRIFATIDPAHPWNELVESSYAVLEKSMELPLGSSTSAGLPPDWIRINKTTGELVPPEGELTTDFSYDALRVPWRLALDWKWFKDERDKQLLERMRFLTYTWEAVNAIGVRYAHDGELLDPNVAPAMYGGAIGYFLVADEKHAGDVYREKLVSLYNPAINEWRFVLPYYDDNWAWFGIALYNNLLPNLTEWMPPTV